MVRCITCNVFHMRQFSRFFNCLAWFVTTNSTHAVTKQQDVRWCHFRWSIPLSIDYVLNSIIDRAISTHSCSCCMWNRWCQNHCSILPNFQLFAWFNTVEFNRLPYGKSKMYDDVVFDDGLRYQLTYVWSVYIDRAISTPWYSYCI